MLSGAGKLLAPAIRSAIQTRSQSVVSGAPKRKLSPFDRYVLGGGMVLAILAYPAWVVTHIPSYRGKK